MVHAQRMLRATYAAGGSESTMSVTPCFISSWGPIMGEVLEGKMAMIVKAVYLRFVCWICFRTALTK